MKKLVRIIVSSCVINALVLFSAVAAQKQLIAGAGPSTKVVQLFVEKFASNAIASQYKFSVPPISAKHAGGIKASSKFIFGRTGRPLNAKEINMNKSEIILARIPIAFATGKAAGTSAVNLKQLEQIFTSQTKNWSAVGGTAADIFLAGREKGEALFTVLINDFYYPKNLDNF
jgi:ABC-type phosphate transport system substrate-binding protein